MNVLIRVCFCLGLMLPLPSYVHAAERAQDFTVVAQKAIPAVVSVTTKTKNISDAWHTSDDLLDERIVDHFFDFFHRPMRKKTEAPAPAYIQQGSGFLISRNGHVLTNAYLTRGTEEILVHLNDGREFAAVEIGQDPNTDIALLKITGEDFPFLELGDSLKAEIGASVAAIGNPKGIRPFLTTGVISALSQGDVELNRVEDFLHTDALINLGNSGGPLLTLDAKVIGMNTALIPHTRYDNGIGFVIPSHMIRFVVDALLENGQVVRGYLGVRVQQTNQGVRIADVQPGSPADKAGLKAGDVIVQYQQKPVETAVALKLAIARTRPNSEVSLQIVRDKQPKAITARVAQFINSGPFALINDSKRSNLLDIEVETLTPELAQKYGLIGYTGVIVKSVAPKSMAAWQGISIGTLILELNHQPIETTDDFYKAAAALKKGDNVLIRVREDALTHYITFHVQ